jgi:hypothetical protein
MYLNDAADYATGDDVFFTISEQEELGFPFFHQ